MSHRLAQARERERVRVMREVSAIAVRLFDERGYGNVTMEEVADASEVSVATLYRRFATKESLVCWQSDEQGGMVSLVDAAQAGRPMISAAIDLAHGLSDDAVDAIEATARTRLRLIAENAALQRAARDKSQSFITAILAASETTDPRTLLERETEARCVAAAFEAANNAWLRGEGSLRDCTLRALDVLVVRYPSERSTADQ